MIQFDTLPAYTPTEDFVMDTIVDSAAATPQYSCIYDSIFQLTATAPQLRRSLFTHHLLPAVNSHEIEIFREVSSGWLLGVIALAIFFLCSYLRSHQLQLLDILHAAFDHHAQDRITRDASIGRKMDYPVIALISLIPISLIIFYAFVPKSSTLLMNVTWFLVTLVSTYGIYFLHNGLVRFLGSAFDNEESVNYYVTTDYFFLLMTGIIATALSFFVCFSGDASKTFLNIFCGVAAAVFVLRLFRCLQLILTLSKTAKFYLFYYLCILEIAPLAIAAKVAISF